MRHLSLLILGLTLLPAAWAGQPDTPYLEFIKTHAAALRADDAPPASLEAWGEQREMREHYNEMLVSLSEQGTGRSLNVRFRAFDDGIGFRYEVPALTPDGNISIIDELTEYKVDEKSRAWWKWAGNYHRYEFLYKTTALNAVERAHTPFTLQTPEAYRDFVTKPLSRETGASRLAP